jgi:5-methylthioadenosine/S-adenosylhomocysteine deaminase
LIKGGCVLTLGSGTRNHAIADILIEADRIAEIGPDLRSRGAEVIDASDTIVIPGFVDTHRHAWRGLFRNLGDFRSSPDEAGHPDTYKHHYTPDDVYAGTLISLLGAVEAGITTVVDWADVGPDDEYMTAAIEAHADSGVRTVLVSATAPWATNGGSSAADVPNLTQIAAGLEAPQNGDDEETWRRVRSTGVRVHAHIGVNAEDDGKAFNLGKAGLLGPDVTLVHCINLGESDMEAISSSDTRVSMSPSSEMTGGFGTPPIQKLIDHGIRPGLGVGDQRFAPGDMFAQMRATNSIQHATMFDLKLAGKASLPTLLNTRDVIRYATIDGARTAGTSAISGSIEVGKQADLIVLRADRPNIAPINDPIGAVVWGMDTSNLDWVIVAGKPLMREGTLTADVSRARDLAMAAHARVSSASGLQTASGERP